MPTSAEIIDLKITPRSVVSISSSPFTGQQQVQEYPGQWWNAEIELAPMRRAVAEEYISFLLKLNGKLGTFLFGDPLAATPRGIATGAPQVNGAHAAGVNSLSTKGWTISQTGILKAGDQIQLGTGSTSRMYKNLSDVNSDGSGNAVIDIWPRLRAAAVNSEPIVVNDCKSIYRLSTNDMSWSVGQAQIYGLAFGFMEAI